MNQSTELQAGDVGEEEMPSLDTALQTVVGWQGVRCVLPPDWNVAGFSMERESGYLRIDAPSDSSLTVQIRWTDAGAPDVKTPYHVLAKRVRKLLRRPEPKQAQIDLKANLDKFLKEIAKQSKKSREKLDAHSKPERVEREDGKRRSINFSWSGAGKGQGKIWHCQVCNRVLVAQVVGMGKDQNAIAAIASRLFQSLEDHTDDGFDLWALYDLQVGIPDGFRLESQKLLSGYLHLAFQRGAERIVVDRWGLANITLKKFTVAEWFANHAQVNLRSLQKREETLANGHTITRFSGKLSVLSRLVAIRQARFSLRGVPTRFEGGVWHCPESNKIYSVQIWRQTRAEKIWEEVLSRCVCH